MEEEKKEMTALEKLAEMKRKQKELAGKLSEEKSKMINPETGFDRLQMETMLDEFIKERGIGYEHLKPELRKWIEATQGIKVKLVVPEIGLVEFQDDGMLPMTLKVIEDVRMGNNVMLIGPAGTGKTELAKTIAEILQKTMYVINCNQYTSPLEITGGQTIEGYQEGKLILAWGNKNSEKGYGGEEGVFKGGLLLLDELPKLEPNTAGILNDGLSTAKSHRANKVIENSRGDKFQLDGFICIATGNIYPNKESVDYVANFKQDLSLLDRFSGSVYLLDIDEDSEKRMVTHNGQRPDFLFIWEYCNKLRTAIRDLKFEKFAIVSRRTMTNFADTFQNEVDKYVQLQKAKTSGNKEEEIAYEEAIVKGKKLADAYESFFIAFNDDQVIELKRVINWDEEMQRISGNRNDAIKRILE